MATKSKQRKTADSDFWMKGNFYDSIYKPLKKSIQSIDEAIATHTSNKNGSWENFRARGL